MALSDVSTFLYNLLISIWIAFFLYCAVIALYNGVIALHKEVELYKAFKASQKKEKK